MLIETDGFDFPLHGAPEGIELSVNLIGVEARLLHGVSRPAMIVPQ
jgi:hypothetical protein